VLKYRNYALTYKNEVSKGVSLGHAGFVACINQPVGFSIGLDNAI